MLLVVAATAILLPAGRPSAAHTEPQPAALATRTLRSTPPAEHTERTAPETLWIFDADFEDLSGDNAGWKTCDTSGTPGYVNYWHKDTIRIRDFTHLGDSTWWCGTYNECWRQPRGYGNEWICSLSRGFPELAGLTSPGDTLVLEYDQRYAMENYYDYGYTEVSTDGGVSWTTLWTVCDPAWEPGVSQDWDSTSWIGPGHMQLDVSDYAGEPIELRFRMESDMAYSSQDQYNNPPYDTCLDGAWQLDNITWLVNGEVVWIDDCESPGDNGWVHENISATGKVGVEFERGLLGVDFEVSAFSCNQGAGWVYAAVDPSTDLMVDGQRSWLMSPPIDISGAEELIGQWHMWVDLPPGSNDYLDLALSSHNIAQCVSPSLRYVDEEPGRWNGGPYWVKATDDWTPFAGNDWLGIKWAVMNVDPPEPGSDHGAGIFLNRQRVGIRIGGAGDSWGFRAICGSRFRDWFKDDITEALTDSAVVEVVDHDDVATVTLLASADDGATWQSYPCTPYGYNHPRWIAPPPTDQIAEGAAILYYFEAVDELGQTGTFPDGAPDECFEFSILPRTASIESPGVLLVDKHRSRVPGEERSWRHSSLDYYREALDILGFAYDVYEVESPGTECDEAHGPDTSGMKYYDTQIWAVGNLQTATLTTEDRLHLMSWLSEASEVSDRNLLVAGDNVGKELVGDGVDTLGFYADWLAVEYVADAIGDVTVDSIPVLRDAGDSLDFMTFDDRRCRLRGGCPELAYFDVIQPEPTRETAEVAVQYVRADMTVLPAGVAYTDTTTGYQAVTLGFGLESMVDVPLPNGSYASGMSDRVDLLSNVMEYFGRPATGPGTGVTDGALTTGSLGHAHPNPFNPATTIEFSTPAHGRVTARIYDLAGRLIATPIDEALEPGPHLISWDGRTGGGRIAPSGVYFVKVEAPGLHATRKLVLLK
jgi:hypothetical protein